MNPLSQSQAIRQLLDLWKAISQAEGANEIEAMRCALNSVEMLAKVFGGKRQECGHRGCETNDDTEPTTANQKRVKTNPAQCPKEQFARDWAEGYTKFPFVMCERADLYRAYRIWCEEQEGQIQPVDRDVFYKIMRDYGRCWNQFVYVYEDRSYQGEKKRITMFRHVGHRQCPIEKNENHWYTDCNLAFKAALAACEHAA